MASWEYDRNTSWVRLAPAGGPPAAPSSAAGAASPPPGSAPAAPPGLPIAPFAASRHARSLALFDDVWRSSMPAARRRYSRSSLARRPSSAFSMITRFSTIRRRRPHLCLIPWFQSESSAPDSRLSTGRAYEACRSARDGSSSSLSASVHTRRYSASKSALLTTKSPP